MEIALVTGASQGLGLEWCVQLHNLGYKVILTARNLQKAKSSVVSLKALGLSNIEALELDVTNINQIKKVAQYISNKYSKYVDTIQ